MFQTIPEFKIGYDEDGNAVGSYDTPDEGAQLSAKDYILQVNTEFMSGKGPDIISADVISYYKFVDNGMFMDMAAYMDSDPGFNKEDYWYGIFNAARYKGGQYIFPVSFLYPFLAYDASLFNDEEKSLLAKSNTHTFEQLFEIAKPAFERNNGIYMFGMTGNIQYSSIYYRAIETNYSVFVDLANRKAHFDDGRFEAFLSSIKEYADAGYLKASVPENEADINTNERFFYKHLSMSSALLHYFDKDYYAYDPGMGNTSNDVVAGMFADSNGNVNVYPGATYCINENSANKRMAWEFMKLLASEQMQSELELWLPPVNIKAFEKIAKWDMSGNHYERTQAEPEIPEGKQEAYDSYMACVEELTSLVNACLIRDGIIDEMILEEVTLFFEGTKSAADVAKAIQNKANLYLSE